MLYVGISQLWCTVKVLGTFSTPKQEYPGIQSSRDLPKTDFGRPGNPKKAPIQMGVVSLEIQLPRLFSC